MPEWADTPSDIAIVLGIVSVLMGAVGWWMRAEIRKNAAEIKANGEQLQPNHGTTLRDAIDRIEINLRVLHDDMKTNASYARKDVEALGISNAADHKAIDASVVRLNDRINDHLTDHLADARWKLERKD